MRVEVISLDGDLWMNNGNQEKLLRLQVKWLISLKPESFIEAIWVSELPAWRVLYIGGGGGSLTWIRLMFLIQVLMK
jgi:hypothetical protein